MNTTSLKISIFALALVTGCASLPDPAMKKHAFPKSAFFGDVKRPYTKLGMVKTRVDYNSLDWKHEESQLCKNAFNKAAQDLVKMGAEQGADAVIKLQAIVFYEDGTHETFEKPECSDDGQEGQVLAAGLAVKWIVEPLKPTSKQ